MFKGFFSKKKKTEPEPAVQFVEESKPIEDTESAAAKPSENNFEPNRIDWLINDSILTFLPRELYMHYWDSTAEKDLQDPSWQNQGIFFWTDKEAFENKSLPEFFDNLERKLFIFNTVPDYISLVSAKAMPWFGMPGGGDKFCLRYDDKPITIEEALKLNIIQYIEIIELNYENLSVLNDRDHYSFLIDPNEVQFQNQLFYLNGEEISLAALYQKKKLIVIKLK